MIRRPPRSTLFPTRRSSDLNEHKTAQKLNVAQSNHNNSVIDVRHAQEKIKVCFERDAHRSQNYRSEEHTSELQSRQYLVCRLLLEKKKKKQNTHKDAKIPTT